MKYIAFLRAINVGGHSVKMDVLRAQIETLGFNNVETFIASGNVILESRARAPAIAKKIEEHLYSALGYEVATFIRTAAEVGAIASYKTFGDVTMRDAGPLWVGFLEKPLAPDAVKLLMGMKTGIDDFHAHGSEIYWLRRNNTDESTFTNGRFERALRTRVTFRGINTVTKLAAKYTSAQHL